MPNTPPEPQVDPAARERADTLIEALPYLQRFRGQTVVIKYGGAAMQSEPLRQAVMQDTVLLHHVGIRPVLVHGGGPELSAWMERLGLQATFVGGLRVTDPATMELAEMVLAGKLNKTIVAALGALGARAVGICGKDGGLIRAKKMADREGRDLGAVGEIEDVDPAVLNVLTAADLIPVVASVSAGPAGEPLNINADHAAGAVAGALKAVKLVILTDVPGVLADAADESSLISTLSVGDVRAMLTAGRAHSGMIPKLEACLTALSHGVQAAHIVDGRLAHCVLMELFTDRGVGTMVVPDEERLL